MRFSNVRLGRVRVNCMKKNLRSYKSRIVSKGEVEKKRSVNGGVLPPADMDYVIKRRALYCSRFLHFSRITSYVLYGTCISYMGMY